MYKNSPARTSASGVKPGPPSSTQNTRCFSSRRRPKVSCPPLGYDAPHYPAGFPPPGTALPRTHAQPALPILLQAELYPGRCTQPPAGLRQGTQQGMAVHLFRRTMGRWPPAEPPDTALPAAPPQDRLGLLLLGRGKRILCQQLRIALDDTERRLEVMGQRRHLPGPLLLHPPLRLQAVGQLTAHLLQSPQRLGILPLWHR